MTVTNVVLLDAYAQMAQQAYDPNSSATGSVAGPSGTYIEIAQMIDGPNGFQARAFYNHTTNDLVISFAGTEGFADANLSEVVPDLVADLGLVVAGVSPQDAAAQLFIQQAVATAQIEAGLFGSFDVTYVGHSLGGFLAQTASSTGPEGEVVAFNSPGAGGFLGLPNENSFPAENYTYVYSDNNAWDPLSAAIHSVGTPLSDNIYIVPGSGGHALENADGTGLGDALIDTAVLVPATDDIFIPVDEALQLLGAAGLLDFFDSGDSGTGSEGDGIVDGTSASELIDASFADAQSDAVSAGADMVSAGAGDDTISAGQGDDTINGGEGQDTVLLSGTADAFVFAFNGNLTVSDTNGVEGTDTLIDIETITFGDGSTAVINETADRTTVSTFDADTSSLQSRYVFDSGDVAAWTSFVNTFNETGTALTSSTVNYDDGRVLTRAYDDAGVRTSQTMTDVDNTHNYTEIVIEFAADGTTRTGTTITYDDGRVAERSYDASGSLRSQTVTDSNDTRAWSNFVTTFAPDGMTRIETTSTYDDGRVLLREYDANGVRSAETMTDVENAHGYTSYTSTFADDGTTLVDSIVYYDDGRVLDRDYDANGVRTSQTMTDVADVHSWYSYTQTFAADGTTVLDTVYEYDPLLG